MEKMFDSSFRYDVSSFPHTDTSSRVVVFRVRLVELPVRLAVLRRSRFSALCLSAH